MNKVLISLGALITVLAIGGVLAVTMPDNDKQASNGNNNDSMGGMQMPMGTESTASKSQPSSNEVQSGNVKIDIANFDFAPETVKVKKGTIVTWTNQDTAKHDVTPDNESNDFKASELLAKGESYSFTFNKAGTYSYFCSPHPYMKATIEVVE